MKIKILATLVFCSVLAFGQDSDSTSWQFRVGAGYAPGFITENTQTSQAYLNLGFKQNSFEVRLETFYFLNTQGDRPRFNYNHQAFLGANYKFLKGDFNPFIGGQVGLAYAESSEYGIIDQNTGNINFEPAINPLASISAGFEYAATDRLFFSLEGKQIFGRHVANSYPTYLDEFRVSIGVGFNLINKNN